MSTEEGRQRRVLPSPADRTGRGSSRAVSRSEPGATYTELTTMHNSEIRRIAFVGDYLPRKCGIATFTHDMRASVAGRFPYTECFVVPVNDHPEGYEYPPEVRCEIEEQDRESYLRAADFLNFANT